MRAAQARRLSTLGELDRKQTRQTQLGADSINRFDEMIGMEALGSLVPILRAQVLLLDERFVEALALLEASVEDSLKEGLDRMACVMLPDAAWCRLNMHDVAGARRDALAAASRITKGTHIDDCAMTHRRLAQIYTAFEEFDAARDHASRANAAWQIHAHRQSRLVTALRRAVDGL